MILGQGKFTSWRRFPWVGLLVIGGSGGGGGFQELVEAEEFAAEGAGVRGPLCFAGVYG